jgi:hypothetical protein
MTTCECCAVVRPPSRLVQPVKYYLVAAITQHQSHEKINYHILLRGEKREYNRNWKNQVFNLFLSERASENKANNKQKQFQALIIDLIQLSSLSKAASEQT